MPCMSCKTMSIVVGSPFNDGPSGADPTIQSMTRHGDRLCSLHDLHGQLPLYSPSRIFLEPHWPSHEDRQGLPCLAGLLNTNFQLFYHCLAGSCMLCCGPKVKTPLLFVVWCPVLDHTHVCPASCPGDPWKAQWSPFEKRFLKCLVLWHAKK